MLKIKVLAIGKCKEEWLRNGLAEYEKRLSPHIAISWIFPRNDFDLGESLKREPFFIALSPDGEMLDSLSFSQKLMRVFEKNGSRAVFVIGGPDGLPQTLLAKASMTWSLSPLTMTHQIARLVLMEQIYRGLEISKNTPYHKYTQRV